MNNRAAVVRGAAMARMVPVAVTGMTFNVISVVCRTRSATTPNYHGRPRDLQGRFLGIDPRKYANDPGLLEKRINDFLGDMAQVELALRRNADAGGGSPHMETPQQVPPGYANAVAEYFRRLSKDNKPN